MPLAAVCSALGEPLEVRDLELAPPRRGEVRLKLGAAGICASDLSVQKGALPSPLPVVLGHEAAGVVTETGDGVALELGDQVVVAAQPQCGHCFRCQRAQPHLCEVSDGVLFSGALQDGTPRFSSRGDAVHQFVATGTFAQEVVVSEISTVRIPREIAPAPAALIGCGVLTGAGAALNAANIVPDCTVAVLGCGAVGNAAIQGARLAGAGQIIAIDLVAFKLELARAVGATAIVDAAEHDPIDAVRELTGGRGADVTIEAIGIQATVDQAIRMTGKGGEVVFVGVGGPEVRVNVGHWTGLVGSSKTFKGVLFGAADIQRDVTRIIEHYQDGTFLLDELVTRSVPIEDINEGLHALGRGDTLSTVVAF